MNFVTNYKLEKFIKNTEWDNLTDEVKARLRGCFIDLLGALVCGTLSDQFKAGVTLAESIYGGGDIAVIGTDKKFSFSGASCAMGHSSNAYDIDDGHNIIRAHPGTSFIGGILAAAYEKDVSLKEFFVSLLVAYETTIRSGAAIMDYYKYAHSSGTFGAVGVAAGVGRIYGFTEKELNNVLSVAEFNAPLVPGIRSVEYPSMNKDGVPFGVMIGALAISASKAGFTGNKNLLESDEYRQYLDDLGKNYEIMNLYFKPYPCCRWAHPAIDAVVGVMKENSITSDKIEKIVVKTFERATLLSKIEPRTADEAQYNIAYPTAAAAVYGDFGIERVMLENLSDKRVLDMMKKLSFEVDLDIDAQFPKRRICRAEIYTADGKTYVSPECEPRGEAHENIGNEWLEEKFYRMTALVLPRESQHELIDMIMGDVEIPIRRIVDATNSALTRKI